MSGKKFDNGKLRYDLVPPAVLEQLATVLTFGAEKYGANNWQTVPDARNRYYAAMMRHVEADRGGEVFDEESKLPHLTHALACVAFMLHDTLTTGSGPKQRPGCKVPPEFEPLLEWLGPVDSIKFLDNADDLPGIAEVAPIDFINCAFTWRNTPEGSDYWSDMAKKWRAYLESPAGKSKIGLSAYTSRLQARVDAIEPLIEWLGPVESIKFLKNADDLERVADMAPSEFVNCAFTWRNTPEGFGYWSEVAKKWRAHLDPEVARNLAIWDEYFSSSVKPKGGV